MTTTDGEIHTESGLKEAVPTVRAVTGELMLGVDRNDPTIKTATITLKLYPDIRGGLHTEKTDADEANKFYGELGSR